MRYSNNNYAYRLYNLRTSTIIESINVMIVDSRATKLVEPGDNDVFGNWGSFENAKDNTETCLL